MRSVGCGMKCECPLVVIESTTAPTIRITSHASLPTSRLQLQHLAQPSLAVLFIDCVDDAPHDTKSPIHPMEATNLPFRDCFVGSVKRFRARSTSPVFTGESPIVSKGLYGANETDRLSARSITLRRTAGLGILAIALMMATPSLDEA